MDDKNATFEKNKKLIARMGDAKLMAQHLQHHTEEFAKHAPDIAVGINTATMTGQQFLQSKIPQAPNPMLLSKEHKPSRAAVSKFNSYYDTVNDPISVLSHVKNGTLRMEHMETMQAVYPKLLQEMRLKVAENMTPEKARKIPYQSKLSLAKFLGEPIDNSMTPQTIASNQAALSAPRLSGQQGKTTLGGLKELKSAQRMDTETQELEDEKP